MVFSSLTGLITVSAGPGISSDSSALDLQYLFVAYLLLLVWPYYLPYPTFDLFCLSDPPGRQSARKCGFLAGTFQAISVPSFRTFNLS